MKDTIDMAREAGFGNYVFEAKSMFERFEALVRADERDRAMRENAYVQAEREACAKVCDEQVERSLAAVEKTKRTTDHRIYRAAAQTATWNAAAIRARGNT